MSPPGTPKTLRELVGAYLAEQCLVVLDAETPLRVGANVVHPTRVAVRRARSTLRVFAVLFERAEREQLDQELRWWAGLLGDVRDLDVLEQRLVAQLDTLAPELVLGPVRARLAQVIAGRRQQARAALVEGLDSARYAALAVTVRDWHRNPPFTAAADQPAKQVKRFVARAQRKAGRRLARARQAVRGHDPDIDTALHDARKAVKRHRYAAEAALPRWGDSAAAIVEDRKKLQTRLGAHQDAVVAMAFLRELGAAEGHGGPGNGFTWGVLYAQQEALGARVIARRKRLH